MLVANNENMSDINFAQMNAPINRVSSISFMVFNDLIAYFLPNFSFLLIVSIYFIYINKEFGLGFVFANILIAIYLFFIWDDLIIHNNEYERVVNNTEKYLQELLNNLDKVIYRAEVNNEMDTFLDKTEKSINGAYTFYLNTNYHGVIMNIMVFTIIFLSIWYLIFLYFDNQIDITVFITFFTILLLYRDKMIVLIQQIPDFLEFVGQSKTLLSEFNDIGDKYHASINNAYDIFNLPFNTIRFEKVSFKYKSNPVSVFDNMNLKLNMQNKIIGITGLSGNGKSTFIKLVLRLYKCNTGTIYIDEQNIDTIDPEYIRKNMVYVNQSSKLFDKKIVENMLYGCTDMNVCQKHLDEIMKYDKIKELYRKIDIYNKDAGSLGENLSGGQRQVVNIISGLVSPSKILILDEPTNALDNDLKVEVLNIIRDFRKYKQCIIIITHDRDVYGLFDETLQL
jgi:ABC-type bacteriocin/lantibiotic exporter with double-glycine peptidase domain